MGHTVDVMDECQAQSLHGYDMVLGPNFWRMLGYQMVELYIDAAEKEARRQKYGGDK
jgi:hypothetical protein